jgi:hypothetical protein
MPRDFKGSGFGTNAYQQSEDADPRVGLVNLADVMLVFACGLMLALVSVWNLDISRMSEIVATGEMQEVDNINEMEDPTNSSGNSFIEKKVYVDPMTGKMYMYVEDMENEGNTSTESDTATTQQEPHQ